MSLTLSNIDKQFGNQQIFSDFSISFEEGRITCILGRSGCGKTTLLNIIGGLTAPDSGKLSGFDDRRFSYVFQETRLLPWKTVEGNIDFVLDHNVPEQKRKSHINNLLHMVKMADDAHLYPSQLSGGMSQRVSIARAFAVQSDIILMDEPFAGLDVSLKKTFIERFIEIWKSDRRTVICVTHDIDEALMLGSRVIVLGDKPVQTLLQCNVSDENRTEIKKSILDLML